MEIGFPKSESTGGTTHAIAWLQSKKRYTMSTQTSYEFNESTKYGGFWIRVGAYFVDLIVLLIPNLLITFLLNTTTPVENEVDKAILDMMSITFNIILWWVYSAVLQSSAWQATVGKKAVGLKVVDENGKRISFGRATGRYFASFISCLILGIGYMMVGWTSRKQGLHDMIAGTLVVYDQNA